MITASHTKVSKRGSVAQPRRMFLSAKVKLVHSNPYADANGVPLKGFRAQFLAFEKRLRDKSFKKLSASKQKIVRSQRASFLRRMETQTSTMSK
jgi:hypothetical protein